MNLINNLALSVLLFVCAQSVEMSYKKIHDEIPLISEHYGGVLRKANLCYPPYVPPYVPPMSPSYPYYPPQGYSSYSQPQYGQSSYSPQFVQQFQPPQPVQIVQPPPSLPVQSLVQPPLPLVQPPPQPLPTCAPSESPPDQASTTSVVYPLPGCYTGSTGFLCCNCELETLITQSYDELRNSRPDWDTGNIQMIANRIQKDASTMFGDEFEIIVGLSDLVVKLHFQKDLLCKVKQDDRYIAAYATPRDEAGYFEESRNGFPSGQGGDWNESIQQCSPDTSANLNRRLFEQTINPYQLNKYATIPYGTTWGSSSTV